jgi:ketosteroid isomerase-like protein
MKNTMTTKEIIQKYYDGIARKDGWQNVISDDVTFGGTGVKSTQGKDAYIEATSNFLRAVKTSKVKDMIIDGDKACAVVHYELASPKGNSAGLDVAELLSVKHGKIDSSTIFFDTAAFRAFMAQG